MQRRLRRGSAPSCAASQPNERRDCKHAQHSADLPERLVVHSRNFVRRSQEMVQAHFRATLRGLIVHASDDVNHKPDA
jgi:hypothetical protein